MDRHRQINNAIEKKQKHITFKAMKTKKNEFEEMNSFVNMLINEGAEKGIPFYINLKNRDKEKRETNKEKIKNLLQ